MQVAIAQDFSGGSVSSKFRGQQSNPLYNKTVEKLLNFESTPEGAAVYRRGFKLRRRAKGNSILYTFKFSETVRYVLEFSALKMRVHDVSDVVYSDAKLIDSISIASEAVVKTTTNHGYTTGDSVQLIGIGGGMTRLNDRIFTVETVDADEYKIKDEVTGAYIDTSALSAAVIDAGSRSNKVLEVATPYTAYSDLKKIKIAQGAAEIYVAHPSYKPRVISRASAISWTIANYAPTGDPFTSATNYPAFVFATDTRLVWGSTDTNPLKLWFSKAGDYNEMTAGVGVSDAYAITLNNGTGDRPQWGMSADKSIVLGTNGGCRKLYGESQDIGANVTATYNRPADDVGASAVTPIFKAGRVLFVQPDGMKLRALEYQSTREGYEALDLNIIQSDAIDSPIVQIAAVNSTYDRIYAITESGKLKGMTVNFHENIWAWHEHDTDGEIVSITTGLDENYKETLWACVKRTINAVTTYSIEIMQTTELPPKRIEYFTDDKNQDDEDFNDALYEYQKRACHFDSALTYDGSYNPEGTTTLTLSAATIGAGRTATASIDRFTADDVGRELWGPGRGKAVITAYTSATVVTVEITSDFDSTTMADGEWYLTADNITGLWMLEGQEVDVMADGGEHDAKTVTNGEITLDYQSSIVHIGLSYEGRVISNPLEIQGMPSSITAKVKNIPKIGIIFENSLGTEYGSDMYHLKSIPWQTTDQDIQRTPPLRSETMELIADDRASREKRVYIFQRKAMPCTVLGFIPYLGA